MMQLGRGVLRLWLFEDGEYAVGSRYGHPLINGLIYACRHNTTVAVNTIESIVNKVRAKRAIEMRVLQPINPRCGPVASEQRCSSFEVEEIIVRLQSASSTQN